MSGVRVDVGPVMESPGAADTNPTGDVLHVVLRSQAATIESQNQVIRDQQSTINALSGGRRISLALERTVGEMWQHHFATLPDVRWKKSVESIMKSFLASCGGIRVADFGIREWEAWRDSADARERYGETSLNIILTRVRILFNRAVDAGELHENPIRKAKPLRGPPRRTTEVSEEQEELIAEDLDPVMRALYITALDSAMRKEETRELMWSEIDFEGKRIMLAASRTKARTARSAFLTTRAVKLLKALPRYQNCPWVFVNPDTLRPYSKTHVWNHFRRAADDNAIPAAPGDGRIRFYDATRRTAARRLVRRGAPLPAVQKVMGHATINSTMYYVTADDRDAVAAHALLEKSTRKGPHRAPPLAAKPAVQARAAR